MPDVMSPAAADLAALQSNRAVARLVLAAKAEAGRTSLDHLREGGGYRIKFPDATRGLEAVIVNTGGGLLGGDRLTIDICAGAAADVMVTTQSAEKIYRAASEPSEIMTRLSTEAGACLHWLPMEAILFSGARLIRTIEAQIAPDSEMLIAESAVFGRLAMGEVLGDGLLKDRWRLSRGGQLIFAEDVKLDGLIAPLLDRPAVAGGARAMANLVLVAPDAEARLDKARTWMESDGVSAGASAWEGKLVIRLLAVDPAPLRAVMTRLIIGLSGRSLPRFW